MKPSEIVGIGFPQHKKFYHLENGQHSPGPRGVDRLRTILMARGLIVFSDEGTTRYQVMSLAEAEHAELEIEPIYINKHIEKLTKPSVMNKKVGSFWD